MLFSEFAQHYALRRAVGQQYAAMLAQRAKALENHVGRGEIGACLQVESVNRFLALLADRYSPATVRGYRVDILTLWNAAADEGLADPPRRRLIRPAPVPQQVIECYTIDEARALLAAAGTLRRTYRNGVPAAAYWRAVIALAWDTGLRQGDCWRFALRNVARDGSWRCVQHKTGRLVAGRMHASTLRRLLAVAVDPPCRWTLRREAFGRQFLRLRRAAGVHRGTFKWLRRSSGSYVEAAAPGCGYKHLGHASPTVFTRHYDAQLSPPRRPAPPEL